MRHSTLRRIAAAGAWCVGLGFTNQHTIVFFSAPVCPHLFKLTAFLKLTNTDPFAAWFVVTEDATPNGMRVVRSVLGAISSLPIVPSSIGPARPAEHQHGPVTTRWTTRVSLVPDSGVLCDHIRPSS